LQFISSISLVKKRIPNPVEYCTGQPAKGPPSNYAGHYNEHTISNKYMNIQDQGRNENAGEESSGINKVVLDNEGQEIDLNISYNNDEDIDKD